MEKLRGLKKFTPALIGTLCGMLNGLFGAGGGIAAVPLLKASGIPLKKAHATSLAVILPVSIVSAILYLANGKIPDKLLRKAFGAFMIYAAVRLLLR